LEIARLFAGMGRRQFFCALRKSLRALSGHEICLAKKSARKFSVLFICNFASRFLSRLVGLLAGVKLCDLPTFPAEGRGAPPVTTAIAGIVSEVLSIAAAGLAIEVIKEINRRQEETLQHLTPTNRFPVPPPPPVFDPIGEQTSQSQATANEPASG